ncbi:MAG: hypothetical protein OXT64_02250, partial [Gammaproteobacteria bacterium]|nr:hypothetical protein [Gammaproteobacteria bacterium]
MPRYAPRSPAAARYPDHDHVQSRTFASLIDELDGVDDFLARRELAAVRAPVLLGSPGIASSLAARVARTADSERDAPLDLFGVLVERAQLDAENRGRFGEPFLAEARGAIDTLASSGDLPDHATLGLARAFVRAVMEAPERLCPIFPGEPGTGHALAALPGGVLINRFRTRCTSGSGRRRKRSRRRPPSRSQALRRPRRSPVHRRAHARARRPCDDPA